MATPHVDPHAVHATPHEIPALRRLPLDERLPRMSCAPQMTQCADPPRADERTVIGEILPLPLGNESTHPDLGVAHGTEDTNDGHVAPRRLSVSSSVRTQKVTWDRWLLLVLAVATLAYVVHSTRRPPLEGAPKGWTAPVVGIASDIPSAGAPASPHFSVHGNLLAVTEVTAATSSDSSATSGVPFDPAALEAAAARAWLAGHSDEAARLYQQLALLSPDNSAFASAAAIVRTQVSAAARESTP